MQKTILFIIVIIALLSIFHIGSCLIYGDNLSFAVFRKVFYALYPIEISAELDGGYYGKMHIKPLLNEKNSNSMKCNIDLVPDGSQPGFIKNGRPPAGFNIYDKSLNKIGYIKWHDHTFSKTGFYFSSSVDKIILKKGYKAVFDY